MRLLVVPTILGAAAALALAVSAPPAEASRYVRFGIQDDAWLLFGTGTLEDRIEKLEEVGVQAVRINLRWDEVAKRKPAVARDPGNYDWGAWGRAIDALEQHGIAQVVALVGTPKWANGGRGPNFAPKSKWSFRNFARAAAERFPGVRHWLIWNEPNQRKWLRPASARLYTRKLLNPAYQAIHRANPRARVGGGVTAPRGLRGGVSPVDWIDGMDRAGAKLDAYAHHPYPLRPRQETPSAGGCGHCDTITMATLERLLRNVRDAFGRQPRIWLTEYGYQTNPPDRLLGVSHRRQARFLGEAMLRVRRAENVDFLIHFLYRDEPSNARRSGFADGWQSGLERENGVDKLAMRAHLLPLAQSSRRGLRTVIWGQVRTGPGRERYRLQQFRNGKWRWVYGTKTTDRRGYFRRVVRAGNGSRLRVWSPEAQTFSPALHVR